MKSGGLNDANGAAESHPGSVEVGLGRSLGEAGGHSRRRLHENAVIAQGDPAGTDHGSCQLGSGCQAADELHNSQGNGAGLL